MSQVSANSILAIPKTKRLWVDPSEHLYADLCGYLRSKMKMGECFIVVGKGDGEENPGLSTDDMNKSIETVKSIACVLKAEMKVLRISGKEGSKMADVMLRSAVERRNFIEVRVAVVGNVDSGKSTLLGVLTHGLLDDGRGVARLKMFRHKHERETGRTSSIGNEILGFAANGDIVNTPNARGAIQGWEDICLGSSKVITFIDLAGHEKYLKTTVFGLTGYAPDYCMLIIGANMGIVGMTKEHLGLALALNVPVFVIVTKIDICPPNVLADNIHLLSRLLKSPGCRKMPLFVNKENDVLTAAINFTNERICPVFQVSNVRGDNLDLLRKFLNLLSTRKVGEDTNPLEYQIDELYNVPGVGTVVCGTVLNGNIVMNDNLFVGPDQFGHYKAIQIKGIHRKRMTVESCSSGQTASLLLRKVKRTDLRKGMVILRNRSQLIAHREFEADILILHHPTTITVKYQAVVHVGSIRQTASIIAMSTPHLRTGDRAKVRFRFMSNPEYLRVGQRLVFREGRTKAVGSINAVFAEQQPGSKSEFSRPVSQPALHDACVVIADKPKGAEGTIDMTNQHEDQHIVNG